MMTKNDQHPFPLTFIATSLLLSFSLQAWAKETGPKVGSFAPELGKYHWHQIDKKVPLEISKLHGKVTLIHIFAYHCDP